MLGGAHADHARTDLMHRHACSIVLRLQRDHGGGHGSFAHACHASTQIGVSYVSDLHEIL